MDREKQFFKELEMLTSVKHPNIVTLLGCCVEDSEMIFVIENVSNGILGAYLGSANEMRILTWEKRLKMCIDVAHALNYLHSEMEDQKMIINRDINCYNIGLCENWEAKIFNFWFALFLPPNQVEEALYPNNLVGKLSYTDPEYMITGELKRESDVYSFG
ncbi:calmodulin-binding receptor-like cytoplasmic kinase 2 [Bidens hawaiensis]|uniref:calmodulin-binding receptor-like cytoplasmic kinase 2 n=1 Tax=Bidens hawaiensis TaxID=980011 RepID=UPI00404B5F10